MLYVDLDLPQGALLPEPGEESHDDPGGIVFDAEGLEFEGEGVTGWRDLTGMNLARPSKPNAGYARQDRIGERPVLRLKERVNCGFVWEQITLKRSQLSMAIMFASPEGRASTLMTLNPCEGRDYLFLSETGGAVEMKFRDAQAGVSQACPVQPEAFTLVCATIAQGKMKLAVNGAAPSAMAAASPFETGAYDLFIGCRSDRAGIAKTLGEGAIARLWIWPDADVFADGTYETLVRYWQKDTVDGI